jgi:hypothetical protein
MMASDLCCRRPLSPRDKSGRCGRCGPAETSTDFRRRWRADEDFEAFHAEFDNNLPPAKISRSKLLKSIASIRTYRPP